MKEIFIPHKFISLNPYIKAERGSLHRAARIKREETAQAFYSFVGKKYKTPLKIKFIWNLKNRARDLDNLGFAAKFILDGMVKAKAVPNDNVNNIVNIEHTFQVAENPGVTIQIFEEYQEVE